MDKADARLAAVAALNDPARRRIYRYVVAQGTAVSRDEVANALGLARSVAAFHLERLAELGLLEFKYRRPVGRSGPGAGRPAKLYHRAAGEIALSIPERHYDLAAELLTRAVENAADGSVTVADALHTVAREEGRSIGELLRPSDGHSRRELIDQLAELLSDQGYEPQVEDSTITLRNCPFHALAKEHQELVCGMNLEFIKGLIEAGDLPDTAARLNPAPGRCCVSLLISDNFNKSSSKM
jgi:predicted ArsR family transcriptional regulator